MATSAIRAWPTKEGRARPAGNVTRKSRARGCEPTEVTAAGCRETVESRRHGGERERFAPQGVKRIVDTEENVEARSHEVDGFMIAAR